MAIRAVESFWRGVPVIGVAASCITLIFSVSKSEMSASGVPESVAGAKTSSAVRGSVTEASVLTAHSTLTVNSRGLTPLSPLKKYTDGYSSFSPGTVIHEAPGAEREKLVLDLESGSLGHYGIAVSLLGHSDDLVIKCHLVLDMDLGGTGCSGHSGVHLDLACDRPVPVGR